MVQKRVAVVADVIMEFGGAEKVVDSILEIYPKATVYTLLISKGAREKLANKFPKVKINTSGWGWLFGGRWVSKYASVIKIFSWIYWERLSLSNFDLVISVSHSFMSKNVVVKSGFNLAYICTPPRYLYDEFNEIGLIRKWPINWLFWPIKLGLRWIDKNGAKRPNLLVADSINVQKRIRKYYGRESVVIYPPVDVTNFRNHQFSTKNHHGDYYVWVSRLVKQKGAALAIEAANRLNRKLIVVGGGDERENLEKIAGKNILFVGRCEDSEKIKLIAGARGLIYTSIDEDFGIVPLEALKLGVPVIAFQSGGATETVINFKNGVFYKKYTVDSLVKAIKKLEKLNIKKSDCIESVAKFGKNTFKKQIREIININSNT